jgi:uncharacterized damage-inducible protein DinB
MKASAPKNFGASIVQTWPQTQPPANLASEKAHKLQTAMPKKAIAPFDVAQALLEAFDTNDRINQFLLDSLPAEAWHAEPPGNKGRNVAGVVAHMHNVRVMWLKATKGKIKVPEQLDRFTVTPTQAKKALELSRAALRDVLQCSLASDGRIRGFRPDVAGFFGYLIAHDAHHRGQITMLARQVGHPIPQKAMFGMWEWGVR